MVVSGLACLANLLVSTTLPFVCLEKRVIGVSDNDYVIYDNKTEQKIAYVIEKMTTKDARHIGLSKRHLFRLKKRIKEGKKIVLKKKTVKKLMKMVKGEILKRRRK